jgi:hypothetical protein
LSGLDSDGVGGIRGCGRENRRRLLSRDRFRDVRAVNGNDWLGLDLGEGTSVLIFTWILTWGIFTRGGEDVAAGGANDLGRNGAGIRHEASGGGDGAHVEGGDLERVQ